MAWASPIQNVLQMENRELHAGSPTQGNHLFSYIFMVSSVIPRIWVLLVVGMQNNAPVYLRDIARNGAVYAADSGRGLGGDGVFTSGRVCDYSMGGGCVLCAAPCGTSRRRRSGRPEYTVLPLVHGQAACARQRISGCSSGLVWRCWLSAMSMVYFKLVVVKMLPFDNKSEFQLIVDMPEGNESRRRRAAVPANWR